MTLGRRRTRSPGVPPRWLQPGEVARLAAPGAARPGRTARDWAADLALFGGAVLFWAVEWSQFPPSYAEYTPDWLLAVDPWVGGLACLALWLRRRYPLGLAVALLPMLVVSGTATAAAVAAILTVAVHRSRRTAVLATVPYLVLTVPFGYAYPEPGLSPLTSVLLVVLIFTTPLAWGGAIRSRRQVVVGLLRDAERERREHALRLGDARRAERERIAREMHDVLAHRISLLSVHASALAYRTARAGTAPPLTPTEVESTVTVIRDNANLALGELREVLAVLRSDDPADGDALAVPGLQHLDRLVADAESAGQEVTLQVEGLGRTESLRPQAQRTAYRVVQEGLTNARKHAPGAAVTVALRGAAGDGLDVTVTNAAPASTTADALPGAGVGLTGLAERVVLDGGALEHGAHDGEFRLHARLPWPDDRTGDHSDPGAARR
jgi:signal transduction histidine kinase